MKDNSMIGIAVKAFKKMFKPKAEKVVIERERPKIEIPRHETKAYHEPPQNGLRKDAAKKRRARIRMQKKSRQINYRKAS